MKHPLRVPGEINTDGSDLELGAPDPYLAQAEQFLPAGATVLDYGSGYGRHSIHLADHGFQVCAVDINRGYLEDSTKLLREAGGIALQKLVYVQGDLEAPMFRDSSFDVVISSYALQLIKKNKAQATIANLRSLTKPGGINVLMAYIATPEQQRDRNDLNLYQPGEIKDLYVRAGWEIVDSPADKLRELEPDYSRLRPDGSPTPFVSSRTNIIARKPPLRHEQNLDSSALNTSIGRPESEKSLLIKQAEYYRRSDPELYQHLLEQAGVI